MVCRWCSSPILAPHRADARHCSDRCRRAAQRSAPASTLRAIPRWLRWSATKVPLTTANTPASSTNASTWCDYDTAVASDVGVGVGFVLSSADRIVCVDIDHCLDGRGHPESWAVELLDSIPATYVEVSPSGHGLHVWGFGDVVKGRKAGGVEVYGTGRYITVTGRRWRHCGTSFAELGEWLSTLPA